MIFTLSNKSSLAPSTSPIKNLYERGKINDIQMRSELELT
jgi:hypothetical protein